MQNDWDEGIFSRVNWLYDLYTPTSAGVGAVHIPLLFLTKMPIQHEIYAKSLQDLPFFLNLTHLINPKIIDGAVATFSTENFEAFRSKLYELITSDTEIHRKLVKQMLFIKKYFPKLCVKAEMEFIGNNKTSPLIINRLYKMLIRLIAINLMNPFFEILYTKAHNLYFDDQSFKEMANQLLWQPIFSNYIDYSKRFENLKKVAQEDMLTVDELLNFCWNFSFLDDTIGDGTEFENLSYLASKIGFKREINDNITSKNVLYPDLEFDKTGLTNSTIDNVTFRESYLITFRYLQVNEEFRHYWGLRFTRLLRHIALNKSSIESWGINEYTEFLKK